MVRKRDHSAYTSWANMKQRCLNKNKPEYHHYGGRGIGVCQEWLEFDNFAKDMGERPPGLTLERRDVNGDYCLENCFWATREQQDYNRRGYGSCSSKWVRKVKSGRYEARFTHPILKELISCGYYDTELAAHTAACAWKLATFWRI
ncbi:HNH endonuclease [Synechococcus phage S-CRES2]|nr:HNH endonuclease [Synechococcus phage S-CRES1]WGL30553.1 HNH endonuclease [Synechococcus phage S-CRES2]